jgi:hypothetical protein
MSLPAASTDRDDLALALFEVIDAIAGLDRPWDLQGYGITPKRAEQICELAAKGKTVYYQRLADGKSPEA